jgi:hypothetical protein
MKPSHTVVCAIAAVALLLAAPALAAQEPSPANLITADAIRSHVYFLACDALEGRYVGSRGYEVAARYGESQFLAAGLMPGAVDGGTLSFLQEVPVLSRKATGEISLTVTTSRGSETFSEGEDFIWFQGELFHLKRRDLEVVFVGYGISEPEHGWDDLEHVDVKDKIVMMMMGAPAREGKAVLPEEIHGRYAPPNAVLRKMATMMFEGAVGVFILPEEMVLEAWDALPSKAPLTQFEYDNTQPGAIHIPLLSPVKGDVARAIFADQSRVAPGVGDWGRETTESFKLEGVVVTLEGTFTQEQIPTYNVVGVIEGTDALLKDEYVAVTGHLDSTAPREDGEINNGADDNASGAAGVIEVARVVAKAPPRRSVVFVLLAGEEAACIGARHFVSDCPVPLHKIVADVNLDMIGRTDPASEADRAHYAIDSGMITAEFTRLVKQVNARTVAWPMKYECDTGNSDNLMFHAVGIPAVNFYSGHHDDVNLPTDDPEKLDYDKAEKISRLVYEVTMELGNREHLW